MIKRTLLALVLLGAVAACTSPAATTSPSAPAVDTPSQPTLESPTAPDESPTMSAEPTAS